MTREEVLQSIGLKKRFCKDCNIPINLFDEPYFLQRLEALNPIYDTIPKFCDFLAELKGFQNEQEYFEYYNSVKDNIINTIKENSEFQRFNNDEFAEVREIIAANKIGNKNLYIDENDGKSFISIDMKKANFSALRYYSAEIFKNQNTWEEYVKLFTDCRHIQNSKYIRQVILGACNPSRQVTYEKYLMILLVNYLIEFFGADNLSIYSLSNDEIIFNFVGTKVTECAIRNALHDEPKGIGKLVRVESFLLSKWSWGWRKTITSSLKHTVQFKCVSQDVIHQVVKHLYMKPITEDDLVFRYDGQLARFLKEVDNPWKTTW